jgi:hypothetical protein
MIADEEYAESIKAFAPYKFVIAALKIQYRNAESLVAALIELWLLKRVSRPSVCDRYIEHGGMLGYSDRVIPPLFDISPFFSEPR